MIGLYSANSQSALGFTGLLDEYGGAAAAYSVRRLSSSYSGSLIEVRRSSDNTTQDIGYDANGDLDTTALLAFVGAGDGFVRAWYDQSGSGNNAQQTTTTSQPQIVSSGSVILENGKPSLQFDGSNDALDVGNGILDSDILSVFLIFKSAATTGRIIDQRGLGGAGTVGIVHRGYGTNTYLFDSAAGEMFIDETRTNVQNISGIFWTAENITPQSTLKLSLDNQTIYTPTANLGTNPSSVYINVKNNELFRIGASNDGLTNQPFDGTLQEIIIYQLDNSSNNNDIQTNINDYYSIY